MQISRLSAGQAGPAAYNSSGGVTAAAAVLNDPAGASGLDRQLKAYQALAGAWRQARPAERATLAQALTESPFAQRVQSTLNSFTRAAWAGPDAVPPQPQVRILQAFDGLTEADQQIVAAMQADPSGAPAYASAADYRDKLQADLEAARPAAPERRPDSVTLSEQAQAWLAGEPSAQPPTAPPGAEQPAADPRLAAAIAAYAKAAG